MEKIAMLTVVPVNAVSQLQESKRIKDYNNLPQIDKRALDVIRKYIANNIGYKDLPLACLCKSKDVRLTFGNNLMELIPANKKDSVIFLLEMPDDMIVTTSYRKLLELSHELSNADDSDEIMFLEDELEASLVKGLGSSEDDNISFIPFLDKDRCKCYATFDENFQVGKSLDISGIQQISIRELTAFK